MRNVLLSIFGLFILINPYFSQEKSAHVSGNAYLERESDHSGIKIKFEEVSLTAETDSTYTDASGAYTIDLYPGVYSVIMSKEGYKYHEYAQDILLTGTMTLNDVILEPGMILDVSGDVSGVWTSDIEYHVKGNITVHRDDTLIINPGTTIKFTGPYFLNINGKLIARGTPDDSITFTSANTNKQKGDWGGIICGCSYLNKSISKIDLSYCTIEYGGETLEYYIYVHGLINLINANARLENCNIRQGKHYGVHACEQTDLEINNCEIYNMNEYGINSCWIDRFVVCNTRIYNCSDNGIYYSSAGNEDITQVGGLYPGFNLTEPDELTSSLCRKVLET